MENQEELEYIKRILDGESELFSIFLKRYSKNVFDLIRSIITVREDAEELTQDTFVKAFRKLESFKGGSRFSTWLYRIAYNTAISEARKKKTVFPAINENVINNLADDEVDNLLDNDENEKLMEKLGQAVKSLNYEENALISLYYKEDKPVSELAEILQLSEANVKVKLYRARKKLYLFIQEENNGKR